MVEHGLLTWNIGGAMHFFRNLFRRKHDRAASNDQFASPVAQRLAQEFPRFRELEFERTFDGDPSYGRATEDRIICRERFDLELQEVDEQISRRSSE